MRVQLPECEKRTVNGLFFIYMIFLEILDVSPRALYIHPSKFYFSPVCHFKVEKKSLTFGLVVSTWTTSGNGPITRAGPGLTGGQISPMNLMIRQAPVSSFGRTKPSNGLMRHVTTARTYLMFVKQR